MQLSQAVHNVRLLAVVVVTAVLVSGRAAVLLGMSAPPEDADEPWPGRHHRSPSSSPAARARRDPGRHAARGRRTRSRARPDRGTSAGATNGAFIAHPRADRRHRRRSGVRSGAPRASRSASSAACSACWVPAPISCRTPDSAGLSPNTSLMGGGVANNTPISHAIELGAREIYVLPTGHACALGTSTRQRARHGITRADPAHAQPVDRRHRAAQGTTRS